MLVRKYDIIVLVAGTGVPRVTNIPIVVIVLFAVITIACRHRRSSSVIVVVVVVVADVVPS